MQKMLSVFAFKLNQIKMTLMHEIKSQSFNVIKFN